ncbi:MAG: sigma-54-dependent Fis family transcriptional regulator [bacterium]|nr:sigma-54-dependent Fis family transcriptional regulator [bacterium]
MLRVILLDKGEDLAGRLEGLGIEDLSMRRATDVDEVAGAVQHEHCDLILLRTTRGESVEPRSLQWLRRVAPATEIILIADQPSVDEAVSVMRAGAFDYQKTPGTVEGLRDLVLSAVAARVEGRLGLVASSCPMRELTKQLRTIADEPWPVLVVGERGSGKKRVARTIHAIGPRAESRIAVVACEATPDNAIDSEIFGHIQGAVRRSEGAQAGLVHVAAGGSLILDEVAGLPLPTQRRVAELLRDGQVRMVGAGRPHSVDVRVIATSSRPLEPLVADGRLVSELHRRLARVRLDVPPLRDRSEDVEELVRGFSAEASRRYAKRPPQFSHEALALLRQHTWRGNVSELMAVVDEVVAAAKTPFINDEDLPADVVGGSRSHADLKLALLEIEYRHIRRVMQSTGGNQSKAARVLCIDRKTLRDKLRKMGDDG